MDSTMSLATSIVITMATVVLAGLTAWYVRLTHQMVQETRLAREPNVWVDLEFSSYLVKLIIGNSGAMPARHIRFSVRDNLPWRKMRDHEHSISNLHAVKNGISYLAPGRTLKYEAGLIDINKVLDDGTGIVEIALQFELDSGKSVKREFTIELAQYRRLLLETFANPASEVVGALRDMTMEMRASKRMSPAALINKMRCPFCGEFILRDAKKCRYCLEHIPESQAPNP